MQLSWFLEGESEIIICSFIVMQISNALTQAHPTDIDHFVNNGGNHWVMVVRLLIYNIILYMRITLNSAYLASWLTCIKNT